MSSECFGGTIEERDAHFNKLFLQSSAFKGFSAVHDDRVEARVVLCTMTASPKIKISPSRYGPPEEI